MKIQLKRSKVLDGPNAKAPTAAQMEYGELAVNYNNGDPALFIKNDTDGIVRIAGAGSLSFSGDYNDLTNKPTIGDGTLTIETSDGDPVGTFGANQTANATITLPAVDYNDLTNKPAIGDGEITIETADGVEVGTFTVNQAGDTTISLPADISFSGDYNDLTNKPTIGDGTITINQGGSEVTTFTVNQTGDTTVDLSEGAIYTAEAGYGISINASNEIRIGDDWSNIPVLA